MSGGSDDGGLGDLVRSLIIELHAEMVDLYRRIAVYVRRMRDIFRNSEPCRRLSRIECIGPVTATALIGAVGAEPVSRMFASWRHGRAVP